MFCPKCGANVLDDAMFCQKCGHTLPHDKPEAPSSTAEAEGADKKKGPGLLQVFLTIIAVGLVIAVVTGRFDTSACAPEKDDTAKAEQEAAEKKAKEEHVERYGESPSPPSSPPASGLFHISANELHSAYKANELAADRAYKGTWFIVDGIVENVGKDVMDTPYVSLKPALSVQCMFRRGDEGALASLRSGQAVSIKCKCDKFFGEVILRDCELVKS